MLTEYNKKNKILIYFHNIKSFFKYLFICVKQNFISSFANIKSFLIQSILMALNNITFLIVWIILFNKNNGNINGIIMKDILYLWSLPVISFGISFFVFGGAEYLSQNISKGNLDVYLTQPKFSLIGLITSRSKFSAFGDLVFGLIIGLFATSFNIFNYLFLIILGILSSFGMTSIIIIIQSLAFWFGDVTQMATTYTNSLLITLIIYPQKMYNLFTNLLIFTIIPTFYICYLPINIATNFSFIKLLLFLLANSILVSLSVFIYLKGLKKYESGNSFNLK